MRSSRERSWTARFNDGKLGKDVAHCNRLAGEEWNFLRAPSRFAEPKLLHDCNAEKNFRTHTAVSSQGADSGRNRQSCKSNVKVLLHPVAIKSRFSSRKTLVSATERVKVLLQRKKILVRNSGGVTTIAPKKPSISGMFWPERYGLAGWMWRFRNTTADSEVASARGAGLGSLELNRKLPFYMLPEILGHWSWKRSRQHAAVHSHPCALLRLKSCPSLAGSTERPRQATSGSIPILSHPSNRLLRRVALSTSAYESHAAFAVAVCAVAFDATRAHRPYHPATPGLDVSC